MQISYHFHSLLYFFLFSILWVLSSCKFDVFVWNCYVPRSVFKGEGSEVTWRCINYTLVLGEGPSSSLFLWSLNSYGLIFRLILIFRFILWLFLILFLLIFVLLFLLSLLFFILRAWIRDDLNFFDIIISKADKVHPSIHSITSPSNIAIKININLIVRLIIFILRQLPPIRKNIRVI